MREIARSRSRGQWVRRPRFHRIVSRILLETCLIATGLAAFAPSRALAEPLSVVALDAKALAHADLELETLVASRIAPEARGYGRVLDPLTIGDAVALRDAASAADEAAAAELARMEALSRDQENASIRDLQVARTTAARIRADLSMAQARLIAAVGITLARDPGLAAIARSMTEREAALVRIDVPGDEPRPAPELGVTLATYPSTEQPLDVRFVGPAAQVDPALPGWGLLFLVRSNAPPPGTSVVARIRTAGEARLGVVVPSGALIRAAGRSFVYVARGQGEFERRAVESFALDDGSFFVTEGLEAGDQIVVVGAQQLLSTEILGDRAGGSD